MSNEQINGCMQYLQKEIELLKPPIILVCGAKSLRYFAPSLKGGMAELAGKVIYDPKIDASIIIGINPGMIFFDGSKIKLLQAAVQQLKDLI